MRLKDKVAIITGGGTGIGKAIATLFAAEGATVVIGSRTLSTLEAVAEGIKTKGGKAKAIQADISDEKQVIHMVDQTIKEFGKIDILVNNSAAMTHGDYDVSEMILKNWNDTIMVNLTGTMLCSREVARHMIPHKSGAIVNISSIAGTVGNPKRSPYSASKWGIIGLTETMAIEVGPHNIRVNAISPAATANERFENGIREKAERMGIPFEALMDRILSHYSMRRIAKPSEVASAALFLASDDSSAITGQNLIVSCGFHMVHPSEIN